MTNEEILAMIKEGAAKIATTGLQKPTVYLTPEEYKILMENPELVTGELKDETV